MAQVGVGPRTRENERCSGRVVERYGGQPAHPDVRHGELMVRAFGRDQSEFPHWDSASRVPDHGYHAVHAHTRGNLRVKRLRGPFDRNPPGRGFGRG